MFFKFLYGIYQCLWTGGYLKKDKKPFHHERGYKIKAHIQTRQTECPGGQLFDIMKNWPRWVT